MSALVFVLVFGLLMVLGHAGLMKFAAFLYKRTVVTWRQCLTFGGLLYLVAVANTFLDSRIPALADSAIALLVTFAVIAAISIFYFAPRARTSSGLELGTKGAIALTAIYGGLLLAFLAAVLSLLPGLQDAP